MKKKKILIVDDSKLILAMMKSFLVTEGYSVSTAFSAKSALDLIDKNKFDLIIMDIEMPDMGGLEALAEIKNKNSRLTVIMVTAYGTTQTAIEAMKRGAYDYITKPFKNRKLTALVRSAVDAGRLMSEKVFYRVPKNSLKGSETRIVGKNSQMLEIYKIIGKVSESNVTVLIRGESGTGKELVARALYYNSLRKDKFFLAVNCAAMPESLLESELFGHEKGSFTGAVDRRIGKFQQCDGGTIFLDEIGDMSPVTQAKILRVLQEHTFEPVGSNRTIKVDTRVIAATNKNLLKAVETGEFREDLYYRLKVVTIYMPPLNQRKEDIPELLNYFIQKFNKELGKNIKYTSTEAMELLMKYNWPGNVRELENSIQTAMIMSKKDILSRESFSQFFSHKDSQKNLAQAKCNIDKELLTNMLKQTVKKSLFKGEKGALYKDILGEMEKIFIEIVLNETSGNQIKASRILGISRNTLRSRLKEYNLV